MRASAGQTSVNALSYIPRLRSYEMRVPRVMTNQRGKAQVGVNAVGSVIAST